MEFLIYAGVLFLVAMVAYGIGSVSVMQEDLLKLVDATKSLTSDDFFDTQRKKIMNEMHMSRKIDLAQKTGYQRGFSEGMAKRLYCSCNEESKKADFLQKFNIAIEPLNKLKSELE